MKFKLDENLSPALAGALAVAGHEAQSILEQSLGGKSDAAVIEVCAREARALVALDLDFANIQQYPPAQYAGIVVLRLASQSHRAVEDALDGALTLLEQVLWRRALEEARARLKILQQPDHEPGVVEELQEQISRLTVALAEARAREGEHMAHLAPLSREREGLRIERARLMALLKSTQALLAQQTARTARWRTSERRSPNRQKCMPRAFRPGEAVRVGTSHAECPRGILPLYLTEERRGGQNKQSRHSTARPVFATNVVLSAGTVTGITEVSKPRGKVRDRA